MEGMDVEGGQMASRNIAGQADNLSRICSAATASLQQVHWVGTDRDAFVDQFTADVAGMAQAATAEIERIVNELNDRIHKQQAVSNG